MFKQNFINGRMNKDVDIRLLPKGEYREAFGVEIINSEGSDIGAIEPMYSNKQLTNYNVGENPFDVGNFSDEFRKKLYWFVLSDTGSFLFEWDDINQVQSLVLGDTRPQETRVFSLSKNHLITGIVKVVTQDVKDDLLLFTDDNMQPICINIERAKTYGINGFEEEDILLIKKPPKKAPKTTPTFTNDGSNNIEERFLLFAYRYRYLDGEYSAPSDFTNYNFIPKPFDLDFFTVENLGMINSFNAVKIEFDTGEKQVTEIQLLVKESLSQSLKVIETFSKEKNGWGDNLTKSFIFSNNKTLIPLPEDQLFRSFDNVPRLAKSLSLIENIPVFGNYLEGYDIKNANGEIFNIDYTISLNSTLIESGENFTVDITDPNIAIVTNPEGYSLSEGNTITISISTNIDGLAGYSNSFFLILDSDYNSLLDVFQSDEFQNLLEVINSNFQNNFNEEGNYSVDDNYVPLTLPEITFAPVSNVPRFNVSDVVFTDSNNGDAEVIVPVNFTSETNFAVIESINSSTVKTNRNYEIGIVYIDKYGRRSTVLTSKNNTIYVPQQLSAFQNKLIATINNPAPYWAERYKLVVKSNPLAYQTIYVTEFYSKDFYTWCKLEGNNKDKVSVGDSLIIKKAGENIIAEPIKIKVIEVKNQEEDFIPLNEDSEGNEIIEREGVYMKIKPVGFSMDRDDFEIKQNSSLTARSEDFFPDTYLGLFTEGLSPNIEELAIPAGTSITLTLHSWRIYNDGPKNVIFEELFFAQRDYADLEEWFQEVIFSRPSLRADDGSGDFEFDYLPNMNIVRGDLTGGADNQSVTPNPNGKLYLKTRGVLSGSSGFWNTNTRYGRVRTEIVVRIGTGVYVFETIPKQADNEIFYETEQCFDIVDGNHTANKENQDLESGIPAIVEMDFFNCYTQGNGIESFRVRDDFNSNYLSIDTRPSATSIEEYREVRRFADLTYGKPYVESTNINGLNEFNVSTANFKELDKQYGSVQITVLREGNLLILQEEKSGYVLFGKDIITSASDESSITKIPEILGSYVPYVGNNGIGKNPESLAIDGNRVYWASPLRGTVSRLSLDGVSEINYGMVSHFRNLFVQNPTSKKIGAYDPYFKRYVISIGDEITKRLNVFCGNILQKTTSKPFTFILNINHLLGDIILNFDVSEGEVNISSVYDELAFSLENIIGVASLTIPRTNLEETQVEITVTPLTDNATFQFTSVCPVGIPLKVISIVLADGGDLNKTMINRYRWGASSFFSQEHLFEEIEVSLFQVDEGLEGTSRFPKRNTNVNIQAFKNNTSTGVFREDRENKLGYLITNTEYTEDNIEDIVNEAIFIETSQTQVSLTEYIDQGSFLFNRPNGDENLYLIWDYRDVFPVVNCQDGISASGGLGIYELDILLGTEIGEAGINYNAVNIPDRFQLIYNGLVVADSKYVGNNISGTPSSYPGLLGPKEDLPVYVYDGEEFVLTNETRNTNIQQSDIANGTTEPTAGAGTLLFNKTTAFPTTVKLVVTAPIESTGWNFTGICPVPVIDPDPEPTCISYVIKGPSEDRTIVEWEDCETGNLEEYNLFANEEIQVCSRVTPTFIGTEGTVEAFGSCGG